MQFSCERERGGGGAKKASDVRTIVAQCGSTIAITLDEAHRKDHYGSNEQQLY